MQLAFCMSNKSVMSAVQAERELQSVYLIIECKGREAGEYCVREKRLL